jgi:hypothetical protein
MLSRKEIAKKIQENVRSILESYNEKAAKKLKKNATRISKELTSKFLEEVEAMEKMAKKEAKKAVKKIKNDKSTGKRTVTNKTSGKKSKAEALNHPSTVKQANTKIGK